MEIGAENRVGNGGLLLQLAPPFSCEAHGCPAMDAGAQGFL